MSMRGVLLCCAIWPMAATAQQPEFDIAATAACVAAGGGADCIGRSADQCIENTPEGMSTAGMGMCMDQELTWWDARLNEAYGRARAALGEIDAGNGDVAASQVTAMREMQRAWITFRDARCAFEAAEWSGGTGAGPAAVWCLLEVTAQQALYLSARGREE